MRTGVVLPQHDADRESLLSAAETALSEGLNSVWVADHMRGMRSPSRPILEGWTSLALVASEVDSIQLGTLVMRAGLRPPLLVAKMFQTLDKIAPGRVAAGLGLGDEGVREEQASFGIPFTARRERRRWVEEAVSLIKANAPGVGMLVGGGTRDAMKLGIAAGGWNFWGNANDFSKKILELRLLPGGNETEASWAGSFPGEEELDQIKDAGAGHVIIAVGAANYRERIRALQKWAGRQGG